MRTLKFMLPLAIAGAILTINAQDKVEIRNAPPPETSPASAPDMYRAYCAACHGQDAKGNGPAAPALKTAPPDLTVLSRNNGGKFPSFRVANIIQGDEAITAHGSQDMPMWGDVFRSMRRDEATVKLRVHNLTQYLEFLQEK